MTFRRRGFTLVELLITIAIIGLLTGILVTNVSRSLSVNRLADDVTLLESKIEYIRLLAGSTQQASVSSNFIADPNSTYYALLVAPGGGQTSYRIVKLSSDLNAGTCSISAAASAASCLVEQDSLSGGDTLTNASANPAIVAFKAPIKELTSFSKPGKNWQVDATTNFTSPFVQLTFNGRTATVSVDNFTGKITATYN